MFVTDAELWKAVGRQLRKSREVRGWRYPANVYKAGGPHNTIVTKQEHGEIGNIDTLSKHCQALGLTAEHILRTVLDTSSTPLSPMARRIALCFDAELDPTQKRWIVGLFDELSKKPSSRE